MAPFLYEAPPSSQAAPSRLAAVLNAGASAGSGDWF